MTKMKLFVLHLVSLCFLFILSVGCLGQSELQYRAFNPAGTCSDASNVIIYQTNPAFTIGTYKCVAGLYVPLNLTSAGGGSVTNIATTSPITGGPITTTGTIACPTCVTSSTGLTGSGTVGRVAKYTGGLTLGNSALEDNGTEITFHGVDELAFPDALSLLNITDGTNFIDAKMRQIFLDGATANSPCYVNGIKLLVCTPALTDGQLLIGDTSNPPAAGNITATSPIVVTNGAHSIALSCPTCATGTIVTPCSTVPSSLQYESSGSLGCVAGATYDPATNVITLVNSAVGPNQPVINMTTEGRLRTGGTTLSIGGHASSTPGLTFNRDYGVAWSNSTNSDAGSIDLWIGRADVKIGSMTSGSLGGGAQSYLMTAGDARVTADFTKTTNTTLGDVTGATIPIYAVNVGGSFSGQYSFEFDGEFDADATGGTKWSVVLSGGTGKFSVQELCYASGLFTANTGRVASLGTASAGQAGCTSGHIRITGQVNSPNANLKIQFAQNASSGSSTVLADASRFNAQPIKN